jgi:hypothetical protein
VMLKNRAEGNGVGHEQTQRSKVEQLLDPFGVVMLTRERIQEVLEEAVQRGRVTRRDANELVAELLRRGRRQTEELIGAGRVPSAPPGPPLDGYDGLTVRQVLARLDELEPGELRALEDYERRHANRKTVLDAIERALA